MEKSFFLLFNVYVRDPVILYLFEQNETRHNIWQENGELKTKMTQKQPLQGKSINIIKNIFFLFAQSFLYSFLWYNSQYTFCTVFQSQIKSCNTNETF